MGKALLTAENYVQVPIIYVTIGDYTFGKYEELRGGYKKYPNYVQSLEVIKVNGAVNEYTLTLIYPLTESNDPNYFEKVFSSVSKTRKIKFTYGDAAMPNFLYKEEQAIIKNVNSNFNLDSSASITYTVNAISSGALAVGGAHVFEERFDKPSNVIRELLRNNSLGLLDLFPGMVNSTLVETNNLIPSRDLPVQIKRQTNMNVLQYIDYLVSLMTPEINQAKAKNCFYVLTFIDDTTGTLDGTYFKIVEVDSNISHPEAYDVDVGFPGSNYIFNLNINNNENYSILYDYQKKLYPQEYVTRINADGDEEEVYAPTISSNNEWKITTEEDKSWWTKMTKYPIKASITIKGLLRPALLMSYLRLNIYLYGKKHINSGLYIITRQVDKIDGSGYRTDLELTRIAS